MAIDAIRAVSGAARATAVGAAKPTTPTDGTGFVEQLGRGLENLQKVQGDADQLAVQAATGDLTDVHDYMIAAAKASLATELTVAVRNKAVEAFNEIMRMQV